MAKESDKKAGALKTEKNTGGRSPGLLAAENESGRRALVRIGAWGIFAVGAVSLAVVSNQSSLGWRHEQTAAADLANEARQIEALAQENRNETRRIADGAQVTAFVSGLVPVPVAKAIAAMAQAASLYARLWYNEGRCIKFVYYLNRANVWQPYAGSEAGRYCR